MKKWHDEQYIIHLAYILVVNINNIKNNCQY